MSSTETRETVIDRMAWAMREASELTHAACRPLAEAAVAVLLEGEYLVTLKKIYKVVETSANGYGDDESDGWDVYTESEPWDEGES